MTIAATALVVTLTVVGMVERARWYRASRELRNLGAFASLLAMKDDEDTVEDPFALVIDLRNGRRWTTEAKPALEHELGGTRR
jgi:hypothetical protein